MRTAWVSLAWILVAACLRAEDATVEDAWSVARLDGQIIGYDHRQVTSRTGRAGLRYVTKEELELKLKRDNQDLTVHTSAQYLESSDGMLIDFQKTVEQGGSPLITRGYREGDEVVVWERGTSQRYPVPKETLAPHATDVKLSAMPMKAGAMLSCLTFEADFPQRPVEFTREVIDKEKHATLQGDQDLWKVNNTRDTMPGIIVTDWVDDQGTVVATSQSFAGLGDIEFFICTKDEALKPIHGVEVYNTSQIVPDKPLGDYRGWKKAHYHLYGPDKIPVFSGPGQTVVTAADGSVDLTVEIPSYSESGVTWSLPAMITPDLKPYLLSSTYMDLNDPGLQDLAKQAVGNESNPLLAAQKIETFVRGYITHKDLSVGFASATDTVKSRTGDCTEHAVLAAALGRVVGLPTRVVMGLGYQPSGPGDSSPNGIFAFHMWAEAYLGPDQWVVMDSALGSDDVGHIAFVKTGLATSADLDQAMASVMPLIGKLKIDVLEAK